MLGHVDLATAHVDPADRYLLSPFECRFLAENGRPHPGAAAAANPWAPRG
jgi:hypothetical protein